MAPDPGPDDLVTGLDAPFGDDPQVEAGAAVRDQQGGQLRLAESHADPEAGHARLTDLELRLADAVAVADADSIVFQPVDGEVLPEDPPPQVGAAQVVTPVLVGLGLVDHDRALLATVPAEVALPVAVDVQPPHDARPFDRALPGPGVDGAAVPVDILREADVHR